MVGQTKITLHNDGDSELFSATTQNSAEKLGQGDVERLLVLGGDAMLLQGVIVTLSLFQIYTYNIYGIVRVINQSPCKIVGHTTLCVFVFTFLFPK